MPWLALLLHNWSSKLCLDWPFCCTTYLQNSCLDWPICCTTDLQNSCLDWLFCCMFHRLLWLTLSIRCTGTCVMLNFDHSTQTVQWVIQVLSVYYKLKNRSRIMVKIISVKGLTLLFCKPCDWLNSFTLVMFRQKWKISKETLTCVLYSVTSNSLNTVVLYRKFTLVIRLNPFGTSQQRLLNMHNYNSKYIQESSQQRKYNNSHSVTVTVLEGWIFLPQLSMLLLMQTARSEN